MLVPVGSGTVGTVGTVGIGAVRRFSAAAFFSLAAIARRLAAVRLPRIRFYSRCNLLSTKRMQ